MNIAIRLANIDTPIIIKVYRDALDDKSPSMRYAIISAHKESIRILNEEYAPTRVDKLSKLEWLTGSNVFAAMLISGLFIFMNAAMYSFLSVFQTEYFERIRENGGTQLAFTLSVAASIIFIPALALYVTSKVARTANIRREIAFQNAKNEALNSELESGGIVGPLSLEETDPFGKVESSRRKLKFYGESLGDYPIEAMELLDDALGAAVAMLKLPAPEPLPLDFMERVDTGDQDVDTVYAKHVDSVELSEMGVKDFDKAFNLLKDEEISLYSKYVLRCVK